MLFRILLFSLTYLLIFSATWTLHVIAHTDHTCAPGDVEDGRDFAGTVNRVKIFGIFLNLITCIFFWLSNASCINTQSSYSCSCDPNYIGEGFLTVKARLTFSVTVNLSRIDLVWFIAVQGAIFGQIKVICHHTRCTLNLPLFFNALLENANLDILLSKNFE